MRSAVVAAAVCLSIVGLSSADNAKAAMRMPTQIPPESLGSALKALAQTRDLQVLYFSAAVQDIRTGGAVGELTTDEALAQLLSGTGLTYRHLSEKAITIVPVSQAQSVAGTTPGTVSADSPVDDTPKEEKRNSSDSFRVAQVGAGQTQDSTSVGAQLEEVIVTAQKRTENLQEVPVPVSVINTDALVNNNQVLLRDYYSTVPGLSMTTNTQSTQILSIRGIVTNPGNPTVGITVDDMPFGSSTGGGGGLVVPDFDPGDLSRVEVLRGPQGTLYGASSLGGLIKFVTVDPSTSGFTGSLQAGLSGVHNGSEVGDVYRGAMNIPLTDSLAIRASAFTRLDPGYIDNPVLDIKGVNTSRADGGMLAALWTPSQNLSLKLTALLQQVKGDGSSDVDVQSGLGDLQQSYLPGVGAYDRRVQVYIATLKAKLGNIDLTSISGYNINQFSDSWDYTFALGPYTQQQFGVSGTPIDNYNRTAKFTQEVRLSSSIGTRIDWLLGGFYTHEDSQYVQHLLAENPATGAIVGTWCNCSSPETYAESAAFADLTYHVSDRFDIQLGGRESRIRQEFDTSVETGPYDTVFLGQPSPIIVPAAYASGNPFTYLLTPRLRVSDDLMVYARLASGYQAGGANQGDPGTPPEFAPSKTQNYELGLKADTSGHSLSFDVSVYYIKWQDIQLSFIDPQNFLSYIGNGSGAKSQGAELSVRATPLDGLTLTAWVTYDDAVLTDAFPSAVVASGEYGVAGDRLPFVSRYSGYVSAEQKFPLVNGWTLFAGGDLNYVGDRLGFFAGSPQRTVFPGYAKSDLHAGLQVHSWRVNVFVNNVADKRAAIAGGQQYLPPFAFQYIEPRLIGLNVTKTF